jgi:pyruvate dehydrogenase E1 component alpha subunit
MYTEYTHFSETTAGDIPSRAAAFGIRSETVDGQDVLAVLAAATALADSARRGEGPAFLECNTYRYRGHHVGDINREYYRSKKEEQEWSREKDPIKNYSDWLKAEKHADAATLSAIDAEIKAEMDKAVKSAIAAPYPSSDQVNQDVYA